MIVTLLSLANHLSRRLFKLFRDLVSLRVPIEAIFFAAHSLHSKLSFERLWLREVLARFTIHGENLGLTGDRASVPSRIL